MDVKLLFPEILILVLAVLILVFDWFLGKNQKRYLGYCSLTGLALIFALLLFEIHHGFFPSRGDLAMTLGNGKVVFQGFVLDDFALFFKELFVLIALIASVFSLSFFKEDAEGQGEYYALLLFVTLGCFFLVSSSDLLTLFVSFELLSIPLYILSTYLKRDAKSSEAGMKYFLIGAVTSALLVFGMSLVYASLQTTDLLHLVSPGVITLEKLQQDPVLLFGILFMVCAFAFKMAAVPFHMWAPDVYEGAPAPVVAFLAVAPKVAVIGLLLRLFVANMSDIQSFWTLLFALLSALSMTVGNLSALHQQNLKRLLAYSGISQIGYILVGFAAVQPVSLGIFPSQQFAYQAILFYVVAYAFSDLAAFGVVTYLSAQGFEDVQSLRGLAEKYPSTALILLVSLFSLAGIPPLVGFVGKFYLFAAAFTSKLYWLVALGVVNSVISLFYYLRVGKAMYFEKEVREIKLAEPSFLMQNALWFACLGVVAIGIYPNIVVQLSQSVLAPLARILVGL